MVKYSHWCLTFNKSQLLHPPKFSNMRQIQQPTFQVGLALNLVFNAYISLLLFRRQMCLHSLLCLGKNKLFGIATCTYNFLFLFLCSNFFFCTNCNFLTCSIYLIAVLPLLECKFHKYSDQCFVHKCILEQGLALCIIQYIFV